MMQPNKLYLADSAIQKEQIDALKRMLPQNWQIVDQAQDAEAILTENVSIPQSIVDQTGGKLTLVLKLVPGQAEIVPGAYQIVECANTGLIGVAEHAVTLILSLSRHFLWVTRQTAAGAWVPGKEQPIQTDQKKYTYNWIGLQSNDAIYAKTAGIIGLGYIGREVAKRLKSFGMRLMYYDVQRQPADVEEELGIRYVDLDTLLQQADFVSLHHRFVEGPGGNDGQFGSREFGLMKETAYFINTSRGRMVNEADLVKAIQAGSIAGVGMDVFRYEPLPKDDPLLALAGDNVILTAHVAGTFMPEAWQTTADEIVYYLQMAA
jgi:lactate dehydrogenase-like 2-hydroxyacid dehydrogenase